jgi:hypothetical protein
VDRAKLGKVLMMLFGFPLALLMLVNCIANYIPPTESYKKAPFQFEELFNDKMAQYGMSIDLDSANYSYGEHITKTVPIQCADGSKITCKMYTTSDRKIALIEYMVFTQEPTGKFGETIYIEPILKFMLDEFYSVMTENKDEPIESYSGVSYNEAVQICSDFVNSTEKSVDFFVYPREDYSTAISLQRKADGKPSISISLVLAAD